VVGTVAGLAGRHAGWKARGGKRLDVGRVWGEMRRCGGEGGGTETGGSAVRGGVGGEGEHREGVRGEMGEGLA